MLREREAAILRGRGLEEDDEDFVSGEMATDDGMVGEVKYALFVSVVILYKETLLTLESYFLQIQKYPEKTFFCLEV